LRLPLARWLHLSIVPETDVGRIVLVLSLYVLFGFQSTMIAAGFRCDGNFALGTSLVNIGRLAESSILISVVAVGGAPLTAAISLLATRMAGAGILQVVLMNKTPWLRYGIRHAKLCTIRQLLTPAIAFMAFPLGNMLSFQGMIVAVGIVMGPIAVATFSTLRTLTRIPSQFTSIVQTAIWPEISAAHGATNTSLVRRLHRSACQLSLWLSSACALVILVFGNRILFMWTRGKIAMDSSAFAWLLLVVVANSFWSASSVTLLACNRHERTAFMYIIASSTSFSMVWVLIRYFGLSGVGIALLSIDVVMAWYVLRHSLLLSEDTLRGFTASITILPKLAWH
jgi:O-antigen/teichoic acid export membrane protein